MDRSQGLTPEQEERQLSVAVDELHYRFIPKSVVKMSTTEQR